MRAIRYTAAGGVITDGGQVLVLRRPSRGEVRLPKGHVEQGESLQEAALREAREEAGYDSVRIVSDLGHQVVEFNHQDVHVIRDERYFLMRLCGPRRSSSQTHEQQFIPAWLDWDEALAALSFEAEREWLRRARLAAAQERGREVGDAGIR